MSKCEAAEAGADARYDDIKELQRASQEEVHELNEQLAQVSVRSSCCASREKKAP